MVSKPRLNLQIGLIFNVGVNKCSKQYFQKCKRIRYFKYSSHELTGKNWLKNEVVKKYGVDLFEMPFFQIITHKCVIY